MDLPTYTNIWRIEKRLYKLYDFRLPMPLPVGQIAVFLAFAVPYVLVLSLIGLPFSHTLLWVYVLPPGVLAWLTTRPVLEGKRLPELIMSQARYMLEPRTWCRMAPFAEKNEIVIVCRVWRRAEREPALEVAVAVASVRDGADATTGRRVARPLALTTRPVRGGAAVGGAVDGAAVDGAAGGGAAVGGAVLGGAALAEAAEAVVEDRSGRGARGRARAGQTSSGADSRQRGSGGRNRAGGRAGRAAARGRAVEGGAAAGRGGSGSAAPERALPTRPIRGRPVQARGAAGEPGQRPPAPRREPQIGPAPRPATWPVQDTPSRRWPMRGQPPQGQPAQGQPAQGQPGVGRPQPAQSRPVQPEPAQPLSGQSQPAPSQAAQSQAAQSQEVPSQEVPSQEVPSQAAGAPIPAQPQVGGAPIPAQPKHNRLDQGRPTPDRVVPQQGPSGQAMPARPAATPAVPGRQLPSQGIPSLPAQSQPASGPTGSVHPASRDAAQPPAPAAARPGQLAPGQPAPGQSVPGQAVQAQGTPARGWTERGRVAEADPEERPYKLGPVESTRVRVTPGQMRPARMPGVVEDETVESAAAEAAAAEAAAAEAAAREVTVAPGAVAGPGDVNGDPSAAAAGSEALREADVLAQRRPSADSSPAEASPSDNASHTDPVDPASGELRPAENDVVAALTSPERRGSNNHDVGAGLTASEAATGGPAGDAGAAEPSAQGVSDADAQKADAEKAATGAADTDEATEEARSAQAVRPVVKVTGDRSTERPLRVVERALRSQPGRGGDGWRGERVVVVPGGHRPGKPDQLQRDRARARLPVEGPRRIVVLGCTRGAGQTTTVLLAGDMLASLRGQPVAVLDLNPGRGSLTDQAAAIPGLVQGSAGTVGYGMPTTIGAPAPDTGLQIISGSAAAAGGDDAGRILDLVASRYPLTIADPAASYVPRTLDVADQLLIVAPASAEAPGALAMTFEWLEAHGHGRLASTAITVLNGVSGPTTSHVEQAANVATGRCRAIVKVPWDSHLKELSNDRGSSAATRAGNDKHTSHDDAHHSHPASGDARATLPAPAANQGTSLLGPGLTQAYTALAGVLVAGLADPGQLRSARV